MTSAPCVDCTAKYRACHDSCLAYKGWRGELDGVNAARRQYTDSHRISDAHIKQNYKKLKSKLSGTNPLRGK